MPCLGDGERLLLHDLVQHRARAVAHLVELVDAAHAVVAKNQRAGLQHQLPRLRVLHHVGRETYGTRAFTRRVLASRHQVVDILQQLRLTRTRVTTQQDVDLGAEVTASCLAEIFTRAAEQLQQNPLGNENEGENVKYVNE